LKNHQDQIDPLIRENPRIMAIVAEGEAKGKAEGLREAILDLISDRFPALVVSQVQRTIAPTQNAEQLKKFYRQLLRASDEEEVAALLAQCFPPQNETKLRLEGEAQGLQEAISAVVSAHFSPEVVAQVQRTIAPIQDVEQLKKFLRQLVRASDEEEVYISLAQCFPTH
jgi:hypothetical protein